MYDLFEIPAPSLIVKGALRPGSWAPLEAVEISVDLLLGYLLSVCIDNWEAFH
jgi:hypothetical protein